MQLEHADGAGNSRYEVGPLFFDGDHRKREVAQLRQRSEAITECGARQTTAAEQDESVQASSWAVAQRLQVGIPYFESDSVAEGIAEGLEVGIAEALLEGVAIEIIPRDVDESDIAKSGQLIFSGQMAFTRQAKGG